MKYHIFNSSKRNASQLHGIDLKSHVLVQLDSTTLSQHYFNKNLPALNAR